MWTRTPSGFIESGRKKSLVGFAINLTLQTSRTAMRECDRIGRVARKSAEAQGICWCTKFSLAPGLSNGNFAPHARTRFAGESRGSEMTRIHRP